MSLYPSIVIPHSNPALTSFALSRVYFLIFEGEKTNTEKIEAVQVKTAENAYLNNNCNYHSN